MTEQEIFEKLKEALDYDYLLTDFGGIEVTNLEEYLHAIKTERKLEKYYKEELRLTYNTSNEFINYLNDKAVGDISSLIECFATNDYNMFIGYKKVIKEVVDNKLYLHFEHDGCKLNAEWQPRDNYGVWQQCGMAGDDYSGYLLFPTHNEDEYWCMYYRC